MAEDLDQRWRSTVWMDVTTSWRGRGGPTNGTLRVEQSYATALQETMSGGRLRLCRYHPKRRRFIPVASLPNVGPPTQMARQTDGIHRNSAGIGRRLEQTIRRWRRSAEIEIYRWLHAFGDPSPFPDSLPGDVLLLAGETWGPHDLIVLRLLRRNHGIRIAAVCQDLIPIKRPQFFAADGFIERFQRYVDFLVMDVDLVLAISDSTKRDILEYARGRGGLHGHIETIELGHEVGGSRIDARPPSLAGLETSGFVLSVSAIELRKNVDLLYRVWRQLSKDRLPNLPKLVLVGRRGFGSSDLLRQIAEDPNVRDTVLVFNVVSDAALSWLYRNCAWTLYPSFYEGWGLPISESLANGKFCLASNMSALQEAGQGLVKHIDPQDFAGWRDAVAELVGSPESILEFERRIKAHYRRMTWPQSTARLLDLLQPLCHRSL
jgi:glycosyltransferase involved in cell wall biosynthesis